MLRRYVGMGLPSYRGLLESLERAGCWPAGVPTRAEAEAWARRALYELAVEIDIKRTLESKEDHTDE